eukprot:TRINITY_DN4424_c0_g2_i2.p1 TRINITY_DN4424_c0_g2~~TRINITY_DN4424_c0_g2_i2.p1  ORF type:complete len:283 (+),score=100.63 TRINITY_DN4424_c0_g2_i2:238-1086(+)
MASNRDLETLEPRRRTYVKENEEKSSSFSLISSQISGNHSTMDRPTERKKQGMIGRYIKDVIYGGLDGLITTFAIVSGVAGANLSSSVILILGLANLIADGFSMAVGNYLGTKSEIEFSKKERIKEEDYIHNSPESAREEIAEIFRKKGLDEASVETIVEVICSKKRLWADTIMQDEFGIVEEDSSAIEAATTTFLSFFFIGMIPLSSYLFAVYYPSILPYAFEITLCTTGISIFLMGVFKGRFTGGSSIKSGLEMTIIGGAAAVFAYVVGYALREFSFEGV